MQVVRVDDEAQVGLWRQDQIDHAGLNGAAVPDVMYYLVPVGGAFQLTEMPGAPFEMRDHDEPATRRWVSEWEPVDGD